MSFFTKFFTDRVPVRMIRTHHPFCHPTKGWRYFARPRGTNKRRKLIPQGANLVPLSRGFLDRVRQWSRDRVYAKRLQSAVFKRVGM